MNIRGIPKGALILCIILSFNAKVGAQTPEGDAEPADIVPLSLMFHELGWNTLGSLTHNYGLNYAAAALGTYGLVESGIDWKWNRMAYNNEILVTLGYPAMAIGVVVPLFGPMTAYIVGRNRGDTKLQTLGLALEQTALVTTVIHGAMKAVTGRRSPGLMNHDPQQTDFSDDFQFGFLRRGVISGWPSGHTANAVAAAAVIAEMYPDNTALKVASYGYAAFIGIGMSLCGHWMSDIFAGALLGFATGKTIGKSFSKRYKDGAAPRVEAYSWYVTPDSIGIILHR
jgi:membrane-associated phospholipid phosphatase